MKTLTTNTNRSFPRRLGLCSLAVLLLAAVTITAGAADQAAAGNQAAGKQKKEPFDKYLRTPTYYDMRRIKPINGDPVAGEAKTKVCQACHGPSGNSVVSLFPQLAGQRADYLYSRLRDFRAADESIPYYVATLPMPQQARTMKDSDLRDIAAYFSSQVPTATLPPPDPSKIKQGEQLYMHGDAPRGIPPCQGCHGTYGEGGPIGLGSWYMAYPILRGQHAVFVTDRLRNFRDNGGWPRFSTNDKIMHAVALTLSDDDIAAVANYVASLAPNNTAK